MGMKKWRALGAFKFRGEIAVKEIPHAFDPLDAVRFECLHVIGRWNLP